jgi:hypothetical protein
LEEMLDTREDFIFEIVPIILEKVGWESVGAGGFVWANVKQSLLDFIHGYVLAEIIIHLAQDPTCHGIHNHIRLHLVVHSEPILEKVCCQLTHFFNILSYGSIFSFQASD